MTIRLRSENLTWQVVGDDVVVLDLDRSVYLKLNGSGKFLWESLAELRTEAELVAGLLARYDGLDEQRAAADVNAFVDELRRRGLLSD